MSKVVRSTVIAEQVFNPLTDNLPATAQEFTDALVKAARLGKISGLRRARKAIRSYFFTGTDPFARIGSSIKRTYVALGADTDAYEAEQVAKAQAREDAALGFAAYEAGVAAVAEHQAQNQAFSDDTIAGFAGMESFKLPGATVITSDGISQS